MIPEPKLDALLRLTYENGVWSLGRAEIEVEPRIDDETHYEVNARMVEVPFALAQEITDRVGLISAEVNRRNHLKWLDAEETKRAAAADRSKQEHEAALAQVRELREKVAG